MYKIAFSYIIYFVIMHTSHTILAFNIICILKLAFKRTLTSFNFFFLVIKTHIVNLIQLVLIKIRFNIFMFFLFIAYLIIFLGEYFINCNVNNRIIILLPVKINLCLRDRSRGP